MKRVLWLVTGVIALAGIAYVWGLQHRSAEPAARWRTAVATRGDLVVTVAGSGSIRPVSEVEVKSRATGVVREVTVSEGDRVVQGQILVRIDDPDAVASVRSARANLESARARLRQVEAQRRAQWAQDTAQLRQAEAAVAAARARLQQLMAGPRPEEIAQAEQAVRAAEAELDLARRDHERAQELYRQGFVARQQLDQAEARLRAAQAQQRSAAERLNQLRAGPTPAQVAEARAAVRQAEANLEQARASALSDPVRAEEIAAARAQLALAESNLRNAEERLAETSIRAPVSGLVSRRSVEIGQSVIGSAAGGTPVMTIAVTEPVLARIMVDETDIPSVRRGLPVEIRADSLPERTFAGEVTAISPNAQVVNNVVQYEVTVRVDDPQHSLRLGMTVQAEFVLLRRTDVLLVPREAVRGGGATTVLVVDGDRLVPRPVKTGETDGRRVEITDGLREGEIVYLGEARVTAPGQP
ncbi:MAG: efflux RND transporter periplasmic adaptor subunit, partial [Armatimonadota bacterium]|nr:efflux RND transporter periplasmic adaptor subunit [Armatimonadota bacterium]